MRRMKLNIRALAKGLQNVSNTVVTGFNNPSTAAAATHTGRSKSRERSTSVSLSGRGYNTHDSSVVYTGGGSD